jgi:acetyltransferase-like isoleucine patch superfamily enzyme
MSARHRLRQLLLSYRELKKQHTLLAKLRARHPTTVIEPGVIILGNETAIHFGEGGLIESGAILDMRHGGSIEFGEKASVKRGAILCPYGGEIAFGNYCGVQHYAVVYGHGGLRAGDYVRIAAHSVLIPANHGTKLGQEIHMQPLSTVGITLGSDIWVGAGVTILDGSRIEDGAVIAAGAVVRGTVDRNTIVGGVPAKPISKRR